MGQIPWEKPPTRKTNPVNLFIATGHKLKFATHFFPYSEKVFPLSRIVQQVFHKIHKTRAWINMVIYSTGLQNTVKSDEQQIKSVQPFYKA